MNNDQELHMTLVDLLDGNIAPAEREALLDRISTDVEVAAAYHQLQATRNAIRLHGISNLIQHIHPQMMQELGSVTTRPVKRINSNLRRWMGVAAALLLFLCAFQLYKEFSLTPEKVYASYYEPYEFPTYRGAETNYTDIQRAYQAKDFAAVKRIFESKRDESRQAQFLYGVACMETGSLDTAISVFKSMSKVTTVSMLPDDAEYYLLLSYIRAGNYESALRVIDAIRKDPSHPYRSKVTPALRNKVGELLMIKYLH